MPEDPQEGQNGGGGDYTETSRDGRRGEDVETGEVPTNVLEHQ